jgi:hypothetical protein
MSCLKLKCDASRGETIHEGALILVEFMCLNASMDFLVPSNEKKVKVE